MNFWCLDPPTDSVIANCSTGTAEILPGDVISVETDSNPEVSEFKWIVDGSELSTSDSISLGEDMIGREVHVSCEVANVMKGDVRGSDNATCVFTVLQPTGSPLHVRVNVIVCFTTKDFLHFLR